MWPWGPTLFEVHDLLGPWAIHPRGWWCLYWTVEEREGCHAMGDWMFAKLSFFQSRFVRSHCFRIPSWNQSVFQCEHVATKRIFSLNIAYIKGSSISISGSHVFGEDSIPRFQNHSQTDLGAFDSSNMTIPFIGYNLRVVYEKHSEDPWKLHQK